MRVDRRAGQASIGFFLGYILISLTVQESYPFSRIPLYASLQGWQGTGFVADGIPADVRDFDAFQGNMEELHPARLGLYYPKGRESLVVQRFRLYSHAAPAGAAPGPVRVEILIYRTFWDPQTDEIVSTREVLWSGTARRNP